MLYAVFNLLLTVIDLCWRIIIAMAVMSWLVAFDAINMRSQAVFSIWRALNALTEPLLRPIRNFLPAFGGVDLSPLVLLFALSFVRSLLIHIFRQIADGSTRAPWRPALRFRIAISRASQRRAHSA